MIDIHCHILPGLDDGPKTLDESVDLARVAAADGIETIVATPHIRRDHPFKLEQVAQGVARLGAALEAAGVSMRVLTGGELSISRAAELDASELGSVALGGGPYMLVESPYTHVGGLLESTLFDLQVQGFVPVLAHPERSPSFRSDTGRLVELVRKGILCSVGAGSIAGRFGKSVRRESLDLFRAGLVHNVASDGHDTVRRRPEITPALTEIVSQFHAPAFGTWLTRDVPTAMLAGRDLPTRPRLRRGGGLFRRSRRSLPVEG